MNKKEFKIYKVNDDSFVGIKFENDVVGLYIPALYNIGLKENVAEWQDIKWEEIDGGKTEFKDNILKLLKSISLAKTKESQTGKAYLEFAQKNKAFESMLWLIEDYIKNGIYCEFGKKQTINSIGKINWKKTIKQVPYINQNDEFIYNSIIVDKKIKVQKILTDIYKLCLQMSIDTLGWLWDINFTITKVSKTIPHLYYCNVLKKEIQTTFLDSKKERLEHLLNVLQGLDGKDHTSFSYGVKSYHTVFEAMIDKMFGNVPDISKFYPRATWHFANGEKKEASKLRPDTIMICKNVYYIIDSKYYDTIDGEYNNFPTSSDIQKQITYGCYLDIKLNATNSNNTNFKQEMENKFRKLEDENSNTTNNAKNEIYNVFMLPCDKENLHIAQLSSLNIESNLTGDKLNNMVYLGYAEADWVDGTPSYEKIIGLYIDLKFLIDNYKTKRIKELDEILKNVIKNVSNNINRN